MLPQGPIFTSAPYHIGVSIFNLQQMNIKDMKTYKMQIKSDIPM